MAETVVSLVVDHLVPLLVQEVKFLGGVRQGVAEIKDELEGMKAFLKDAAARQDSDEGIKLWVRQVREIAYDTEDAVDEFLLRMGRHYGPGFQAFLRRCARSIKHLRARHRLGTQIRDIKTRVKALAERRAAFSLMRATDEGTSSSCSDVATTGERLAALFTDESELVGIDKSRDELIRRVLEGGSRLAVIPVVGMGGLGKTTLVMKTYEAVQTREPFNCRAWITVSQAFRTEDLFRSMIRQLYQAVEKPPPEGIDAMDDTQLVGTQAVEKPPPEGIDAMDDTQLVGTLRAYLQGKRYVVVFDDVWSVDAWKVIALALPVNECGSRVMVTTRNHDVASSCCTQNPGDPVYRMPTLASEDAWKLFCKKAFQSNTCPPELEATSRRIVGKCGGLPLAILAIGGLLSRRSKTPLEWDRVYCGLSTAAAAMESRTDEALRNMRKILWLSYDALPYHLRSCFLYFGLFPEDHNVKRSKVTRQWIAEGFIRWNAGTTPTPEAIAEDRLNELVDRNLVQVVKLDFYGRVDKCRIHDLLRDLVLSKAREENFCASLAQPKEDTIGLDDKAPRRLSAYMGEDLPERSTDDQLSHLRTLFVFGVSEAHLLSRFRLLRVLTLKGVHLMTFPCEITNLLHLSYLSMRRTCIMWLPESIGKLGNLQTLDLKGSLVSQLPRGVLKLHQLRHLLVQQFGEFYPFEGVKMPTRIGGLRHMQKLVALEVNGNKEQVEELGKLTQLTKLSVTAVREGDGEALCGSIKKMHHLQSLSIVSVNKDERLDVQSLPTTVLLPLLRGINLMGRLEKLPEMIVSSQNLVKLRLRWSGLRDDPLRALQSLPNLMELHIQEAYDGQALRCEDEGFPRLGLLVISELRGLSSITFERGSMPNLAALQVLMCGGLTEVPFGIEHLTTLRKLYVEDMPQEFMDSIQKDKGKDWGKVKHIPIINCLRWRGDEWVLESLSN